MNSLYSDDVLHLHQEARQLGAGEEVGPGQGHGDVPATNTGQAAEAHSVGNLLHIPGLGSVT